MLCLHGSHDTDAALRGPIRVVCCHASHASTALNSPLEPIRRVRLFRKAPQLEPAPPRSDPFPPQATELPLTLRAKRSGFCSRPYTGPRAPGTVACRSVLGMTCLPLAH